MMTDKLTSSQCPRCGGELSACWHPKGIGLQHCAVCLWHEGQPIDPLAALMPKQMRRSKEAEPRINRDIERYGRHDPECTWFQHKPFAGRKQDDVEHCSCGFAVALRSAKGLS